MYDLTLATALASAQSDVETREVAGAHRDARALLEIRLEGSEARRTNYAGMLPTPIQSGSGHET